MIRVSNLTRYYGEFAALTDVSFELFDGETVGLLGLNGAGKSTTLKILAGLLAPSDGEVTIEGEALSGNPAVRGRIGYLPEVPPLYTEMTVTAFISHIGRLKGMPQGKINERMAEVLRLADLTDRAHQVISTLSHGYRKRVGIAQAIIHDPKLVILDEPISGLDPAQIREMRKVIRNLAKGRSVILSSHILGEISQTCDRLLVINNGMLVATGTEEELMARTKRGAKVVCGLRAQSSTLEAILKDCDLVTHFTITEEEHGLVHLVATMKEDHREQLIALLVNKGVGIRTVEDPEDDLESLFIGLTKEAK